MGRLGVRKGWAWRRDVEIGVWYVSKRAERTVTYWNVSKYARKYREYRKIRQSVAMACSGMAIATD